MIFLQTLNSAGSFGDTLKFIGCLLLLFGRLALIIFETSITLPLQRNYTRYLNNAYKCCLRLKLLLKFLDTCYRSENNKQQWTSDSTDFPDVRTGNDFGNDAITNQEAA